MSDSLFGKIFGSLIIGMALLTVVLIAIAAYIGGTLDDRMATTREADKTEELLSRIKPLGEVTIGKLAQPEPVKPVESASTETVSGEATYQTACMACHTTGVAGAPKLGDASAWQERLSQGNDILYQHAINGFQGKAGIMPPKGGNPALSDEQVAAAVDYIIEKSK